MKNRAVTLTIRFSSKGDKPDPSNNDPSLMYRESVHIASVLDLRDVADGSGLTPSWAESIDKLNGTHNQSLDPKKTLIMSDDSDKSEHSDCPLPEFSNKARQIKEKRVQEVWVDERHSRHGSI
ncbi:hypothetical protein V6N12_059962 [Hibiscus sabdariffa]|uniref:Uncharacterized protein n=1 Tax=Hibiscus sabdariffa TaxID=183260 RepID=A0ABR2D332_9ROSI